MRHVNFTRRWQHIYAICTEEIRVAELWFFSSFFFFFFFVFAFAFVGHIPNGYHYSTLRDLRLKFHAIVGYC